MDAESQESRDRRLATQSHGVKSEGGTGALTREERQASAAREQKRTLTQHLMEKVCDRANLDQAYRRVRANHGAAGVDEMTVEELSEWIGKHKEELIRSLSETNVCSRQSEDSWKRG